jgi:hypothetical protein
LPFTAPSSDALTLQIVQASAPTLRTAVGSLPSELDPILAKTLAKSLDQRYEAAATLAAELRSVAAVLDVRSEASEAAGEVMAPRPPKRRSLVPWIALAILIGGLAAAWIERVAILRLLR